MRNLSRKNIAHLAELARLRISEAEESRLLKEVNEIVGYFEKLQSVRTEGIETTTRISPAEEKGTPMAPMKFNLLFLWRKRF